MFIETSDFYTTYLFLYLVLIYSCIHGCAFLKSVYRKINYINKYFFLKTFSHSIAIIM